MSLFSFLQELDKDEGVHLGRILLLIDSFSGNEGNKEIKGITKLAKLDFLLRYPAYLAKALEARGKSLKRAEVQEYEKLSIESRMVRYRYGPWDFRYRRFLNTLIGQGLIYYRTEGRAIHIGITSKGKQLAKSLLDDGQHDDIYYRTKVLRTNFDFSASWLKDFIYRTFPEVASLNLGSQIDYAN